MKISQRQIEDLLTLISHVRQDMDFGAQGTYTSEDNDKFDSKEAKKAERAIKFIKKLILERDN